MLLRKMLVSTVMVLGAMGAASAADLPTAGKAPVFVPPLAVNWTGLYVGGQGGYQGGGSSRVSYYSTGQFASGEPTIGQNGFLGGGHIGYNYEFNSLVLGLEADVDGSSYNGTSLNSAGTISATVRTPVEGSVRARVGVAWDRALFYGTGGVAFADRNTTATNLTTNAVDSFSKGLVGWTAGGGVDYAIDNNWSIRAEYRYTHLGQTTDSLTNTTALLRLSPRVTISNSTDSAVRVGFNYKFISFAPPVVARY